MEFGVIKGGVSSGAEEVRLVADRQYEREASGYWLRAETAMPRPGGCPHAELIRVRITESFTGKRVYAWAHWRVPYSIQVRTDDGEGMRLCVECLSGKLGLIEG